MLRQGEKDRCSVELSCETEKGIKIYNLDELQDSRGRALLISRKDIATSALKLFEIVPSTERIVMMDFANQETWYVGLLTLQQNQWNWDISFVENFRLTRNNKRISIL